MRRFWHWLIRARSIHRPSPLQAMVSYTLMGVWAFVALFPIYWLLVTSVKLPVQVNDGPDYLPFIDFQPSGHAWHYIFFELGKDTLRPYVNTVVVAFGSSLLCLLIGTLAAYGLARIAYRPRLGNVLLFIAVLAGVVWLVAAQGVPWPVATVSGLLVFLLLLQTLGRRMRFALGNADIAFWILSQRILPPVAIVIPIYVLFQQVGLLDTRVALISTYMAVNLPIVVWLMRDFFLSIPVELEESAAIDGASRYRIFFSLVLPLSRPGLAATFLFALIFSWNEYLLALFLSTVDAQTMPLLVAAQNATRGPQWWYMSVLILIMIVPVIVMAILLERFITRGLLVGAIKG